MTDIAERAIDTPSRTLADPPPAKPEGNPGLIALPLIIAGATGLGFINTGIVNVAAAAVPILLSATAIGLLVTTIWSAALSQNVNATIYGTFFGFYGSYAVLSLGLTHNWFGIPDTGVATDIGALAGQLAAHDRVAHGAGAPTAVDIPRADWRLSTSHLCCF